LKADYELSRLSYSQASDDWLAGPLQNSQTRRAKHVSLLSGLLAPRNAELVRTIHAKSQLVDGTLSSPLAGTSDAISNVRKTPRMRPVGNRSKHGSLQLARMNRASG